MRFFFFTLFLAAQVFSAEPEPLPVAKWAFDEPLPMNKLSGKPSIEESGLVSPLFPAFPTKNGALEFDSAGWVGIPSEKKFQFDQGDQITFEAWLNPEKLTGQGYLLGKGRTGNAGYRGDNQNWGFRIKQGSGGACLNFLFRSRKNGDHGGDWHRWTSTSGFAVNSGWHHLAMSYEFGKPESIRGFLDGKEVKGKWDMGGATAQPPVVDEDDVRISSHLSGNAFLGQLDEMALYREIVSPEILKSRYKKNIVPLAEPKLVDGSVSVQMFGPLGGIDRIPEGDAKLLTSWQQKDFGFVRLPHRYDDWGVRDDWGKTVLIRAVSEISLPKGRVELMVRSRGRAQLWVGEERLLTTRVQPNRSGAHHPVQPLVEVPRIGMRPAGMTDEQQIAVFESPGGKQRVMFEMIVGGPRYRLEFGETSLSISTKEGEMFRMLAHEDAGVELTNDGWLAFRDQREQEMRAMDRKNRRAAGAEQDKLWAARHKLVIGRNGGAKANLDQLIETRIAEENRKRAGAGFTDKTQFFHEEVEPILSENCYRCHGEKTKGGLSLKDRANLLKGGDSELPALVPGKPSDSHLVALIQPDSEERMPPKGDGLTKVQVETLTKWVSDGGEIPATKREQIELTARADDATFLRRLYLDTVGVTPAAAEARAFLSDSSSGKRAKLIDQLLADDRWADNWVGYWQDVLAENPNLLKANLNNSGPFRFWIHEALQDNKPLDRFATELILMRGSTWGGGTAGFAIASQNDVPMAAKAHVIGSAFLGIEMKCARCHDAPFHEWKQQDLFEMAAMLDRKPIKIPETSSVPVSFLAENAGRKALIEVTLKPGADVAPRWPFDEIKPGVEFDKGDSRNRLAQTVTSSQRFAEVMANRIWARLMGKGIVEPVSDWEGNAPSDPKLLAALADELMASGYDTKQLARVILNSAVYQREAIDPVSEDRFFEGPYRRRMSAEQIVDSAFAAAGQNMQTEMLTMDIEGTLAASAFQNFGFPKRAWEFSTLANERDRPSLALPRAQAIVDMLKAFGWRNTRPDPATHREEAPNLIQPGVLANGVMGSWLTRLDDNSGLVQIALGAKTVDELVEGLFLQMLTRLPDAEEKSRFVSILEAGFSSRVVPKSEIGTKLKPEQFRHVSWSNHLHGEANVIKVKMEAAARRGNPPTRYLRDAWRVQMEDAVWALLNSPEMVVVP